MGSGSGVCSARLVTAVMWSGVDKHGANRAGAATTCDLAAWLQERHKDGWQHMVVKRHGQVVGRIERSAEDARVWWAES